MIFLGLERPVPYSGMSIFDPTMANMVLNAQNNYIQAMKEDYLRGREDLKEFNKNFGDFFSPIQKDMEWYDQNVTGATRDFINGLYERGIDPLRSPEARAMVSRWVNSMPTGKINQLKQSAADANEYLKNMAALQAAGNYDPDLEKFATNGNMLDNWDTIKNGIWTRRSPLEAKSLKALTEASFNNRSPLELTKEDVESFTGVKYDPNAQYTGFAKRHLKDIADKIAPGLYGTPYFDYYRDLARRKLISSGIDPTEKNINEQLAQDIADSQEEYLMGPKADYTNYYKRQEIGLRAAANQLARDKFNWDKEKWAAEHPELANAASAAGVGSGVNTNSQSFSWAQRTYDKALANIISDGTTNTSWTEMSRNYGTANANARNVQAQFGRQFRGIQDYNAIKNAYINRYKVDIDIPSFMKWLSRGNVDGNQGVSKITDADISKLKTIDEVVTGTAGYTKKYRTGADQNLKLNGESAADGLAALGIKTIQDAIDKYGAANTTLTPMNDGYGSIRKDTGAMEVYPRVKITVSDGSGNTISTVCYYDMGLHSKGTPGGAYVGDQKVTPVSKGSQIVNIDAGIGNYFPNYEDWLMYGPADIRTNAFLKAKSDEYNAGY